MNESIFMKLEGILGESRIAGHIGEIELLNFNSSRNMVTVTKQQDTTSVKLFEIVASSKVFPIVMITFMSSENKNATFTHFYKEVSFTSIEMLSERMQRLNFEYKTVNTQYSKEYKDIINKVFENLPL